MDERKKERARKQMTAKATQKKKSQRVNEDVLPTNFPILVI